MAATGPNQDLGQLWICPSRGCQILYLLCQLLLPWNPFPSSRRCSQCSLNEWLSRQKAFDTCLVFGKTVLPGTSVFPTFPYSVKKIVNPRNWKERNRNKGSLSAMQTDFCFTKLPSVPDTGQPTLRAAGFMFSSLPKSLWNPSELLCPFTKSWWSLKRPFLMWFYAAGAQIIWSCMGNWKHSPNTHFVEGKKRSTRGFFHNSVY